MFRVLIVPQNNNPVNTPQIPRNPNINLTKSDLYGKMDEVHLDEFLMFFMFARSPLFIFTNPNIPTVMSICSTKGDVMEYLYVVLAKYGNFKRGDVLTESEVKSHQIPSLYVVLFSDYEVA